MPLKFLGLFKTKSTEKSISARVARDDPGNPEALRASAAMALQDGELERAIQLYDAVIASEPDNAEAHYKRANAFNGLGRWDSALLGYDRAIELNPVYANAFCNRGAVLDRLGRRDEALASFDRAIALNPDDYFAYNNRGSVLNEMRRFDEALAGYEHAISLKDDYAQAHINRGNVLRELRRNESAVASYDRAIELKTKHPEAFQGRGLSLGELGRFDEALASHEQAIALKGDHVEAHISRGNVLRKLKLHEAAIESYVRSIELDPSRAEAFEGCGFCLFSVGHIEAAITSYNRALALEPERRYVLGMRRHAQMHICDWQDLAPDLQRITEALTAHRPVIEPFPLSGLVDSAPLQRLAAEIWVREECPPNDALGRIPERPRRDKIRVGYFSADFRAHPVSLLTAEMFETHDRSKFDITAFAFGPEANDPVRSRLQRAFERFIDVSNHSDIEVAALSREMGIDIAVDLGGFTVHSRTKIFALRAAPIQISYIGYLGTMGAPYMDYLVADATIIPPAYRRDYSESIIYLPSYQVNDSQRRIGDRRFTREELGLPQTGFVFSCFNASFKITPPTFAVWMRILNRVQGSSLFLYADNEIAQRNLLKEAQRHGVEPRRIIFGARIPVEHYLARLRTMDLFLDTLPYNAGTTASDALWAGLPVLTCMGQAFAGRYAASLLKAIDLPELIAASESEYEDLAVRLASNPDELAAIRQRVANARNNAPLFDTALFTKNLEFTYERIYERLHANTPLEHIYPRS